MNEHIANELRRTSALVRLSAGVMTFLLVWLLSFDVRACQCNVPTPTEALRHADAVFSGEVISVTIFPKSSGPDLYMSEFLVEDCWKGNYGRGETALVFTDEPFVGTCGYPFVAGQQYVVFGGVFGDQVSTTVCDPTTPDVAWASGQLGEPTCSTPVESHAWTVVKRLFR